MRLRGILVAVGLSAFASPTFAAPIGLVNSFPDITAGTLHLNYVSATDTLTIDGFSAALYTGPSTSTALTGYYHVEATINDSGVATAGFIDITAPNHTTVYLHGLLATGTTFGYGNFGYSDGTSDVFEFVFTSLTGTKASQFSPALGVIYTTLPSSTFNGSFTSPLGFADQGGAGGTSDNFRVPEPASLAVLAIGGALLLRRRRR